MKRRWQERERERVGITFDIPLYQSGLQKQSQLTHSLVNADFIKLAIEEKKPCFLNDQKVGRGRENSWCDCTKRVSLPGSSTQFMTPELGKAAKETELLCTIASIDFGIPLEGANCNLGAHFARSLPIPESARQIQSSLMLSRWCKPASILIVESGCISITDFGITKYFSNGAHHLHFAL